jgi:hypothetical protein
MHIEANDNKITAVHSVRLTGTFYTRYSVGNLISGLFKLLLRKQDAGRFNMRKESYKFLLVLDVLFQIN